MTFAPNNETVPVYVEVKPEHFDWRAVTRRMRVIWESEPDTLLLVASPRTVIAEQLMMIGPPREDVERYVTFEWVYCPRGKRPGKEWALELAPCAWPDIVGPWDGKYWEAR
jgi:hypothetical protein